MMLKKSLVTAACAATFAFTCHQAAATIVLVETNMGDFEINLFDQTTPKTVANFLAYVKDGSYTNTIFHRSIKDFVMQGGGYRYSGNNATPYVLIQEKSPVDNEPKLSNVRGTVAMAKVENSPNSARSQWFINLKDNSSNLDRQNSGFTVFGVVTGTGMSVVDSMDDLFVPATGNFAGVPLRNYSATDLANNVAVTASNLVTVERITVINDSPTTAANLNPKPNTLAGQNSGGDSGSGGGSIGSTLVLALAGLAFWRRRKV